MEKVDSEAPAFKVCGHCETRVDEALAECPECGAPLQGLRLIDNVSDSVHAELSKANLLRMRGEFKQAQDTCLSILKRFPHHFESHLLLADIYADEKQFEQAAQWYELAIDLDPGSFIARQRLQVVSDHLRHVEAASTAEQLGLPSGGSKVPLIAAGVVALLILAAFVAYNLGQNNPAPAKSNTVRSPISATSDSVFADQPTKVDEPVVTTPPVVAPSMTVEDRATTNALKLGQFGDRVVVASVDPRTKNLSVTYRLQEGDGERKVGAELAREGLAAIPEAAQVTVKAIRGENTVYVADILRNRLAETQTEAWRAANTGEDAWVSYVLQNEWFAVTPPTEAGQPTTTGDPH